MEVCGDVFVVAGNCCILLGVGLEARVAAVEEKLVFSPVYSSKPDFSHRDCPSSLRNC